MRVQFSITGSTMWLGRGFCALASLLLLCAQAQVDSADSWIVNIEQGPVKGYRDPAGDLFVFYNIPYATAPTGKDRFKAPLPAPVWITPLETVDRGVVCPQQQLVMQGYDMFANKTMREDCLIASVYVPVTDEKNLPVVFYVHGGGYQMGSGDMISPRNLVLSKKVIFVTFNYRLGIHGFLCLGTPDVPGNAGMKDQVAALRWVHRNIASFGGNPNDVTIQGSSAGSSAVDLLLLSKTTKGLFHRAIPESGGNVATWSVQVDPIANAKEFAQNQNFEKTDDIYALEEFYKTASFDLLNSDSFSRMSRTDNQFSFVPCVERDTGVERFLDDNPVNILKKGDYNKVPMLYGFANMEGLFRIAFGYDQFKNGMNEKFSNYLPSDLQFENEEEKEKVALEIKNFYFGDKQVGGDTINGFIDYYTDIVFAYPMLRSLTLQVEAGNDKIYLYQFSYPFEDPVVVDGAEVLGANHCAQTAAVFDGASFMLDRDESNLSDEFKKVKNITRQFWLNFMTTSTPVPKGSDLPAWPAANRFRSPYMDITEHPQLGGELLPLRARFWDDIYERHYRAPVPPPAPPPERSEL